MPAAAGVTDPGELGLADSGGTRADLVDAEDHDTLRNDAGDFWTPSAATRSSSLTA